MTTMIPSARPEIGRHAAQQLLHDAGVDILLPAILGRRGYYRDTMGVKGKNDRGIYDDALIVVTPTAFATFNANTDPTRTGGRLASLEPGLYRYRLGVHHPGTPGAYPCLVQAGDVTVRRDNGVVESGEFYIHHHRGGYNLTSSEGCQTVWPDQWNAYFALVKSEMERYRVQTIPYLLTARPE